MYAPIPMTEITVHLFKFLNESIRNMQLLISYIVTRLLECFIIDVTYTEVNNTVEGTERQRETERYSNSSLN